MKQFSTLWMPVPPALRGLEPGPVLQRVLFSQRFTGSSISRTCQAKVLLFQPAKTMKLCCRCVLRPLPPSNPNTHNQHTYQDEKKKSGVPAGIEVYYNSRSSDPGKEAQGTSTPRPVCRRMPAHGLYFCAVSTILTVCLLSRQYAR